MKQKGQATLFIVLGIALLFGIVIFYYLKATVVQKPVQPVSAQLESTQAERDVQDLVDSCLKQLSLDGLEMMRVQAGYIDIPSDKENVLAKDRDRGAVVKQDADSIKHVAYDFSSGNKMPFWLTKDKDYVPSQQKMEKDLANFIQSNLLKCLNNFDALKKQGIQVQYSQPNVSVSFSSSVVITADFPITAVAAGSKVDIENFQYAIPVNMKKIYDLASNIAFGEQNDDFLEYFSMDLISKYSYSGGNKETDDLPPLRYTDVNFDCNKVTWTLDEVKDKLKKNYLTNYRHVQIGNTDIVMPSADQAVLKTYIYTPFPGDFTGTKADFFFDPELFFNVDVKPGSSTIEPDESMTSQLFMIPAFCVYKYKFKYTMDYPVIVKITDKDSAMIDAQNNIIMEHQGFIFMFPMWVNVCGNQKRECNYMDYSFNKSEIMGLFKDQLNIDTTNIVNSAKTAFCSNDQKKSEPMTITVKDRFSNQSLDNVQIGYYGGNYENDCLMGKTAGDGKLISRFPLCSGCMVYMTRENYSQRYEPMDVKQGSKENYTFFMEPQDAYNVYVNLVYIPAFMQFWQSHDIALQPSAIAMSIGTTDDASQRVAGRNLSNLRQQDLMLIAPPQLGVVPLQNGMEVILHGEGATSFNYVSSMNESNGKVKMAPGTYTISANLMGKVTINPSTIDANGESKTVSVNPTGIGPYIGDWQLGSFEGTYTFTTDDMRGKNSIIFYIPIEQMPYEIKEVNDIGNGTIQADGSFQYQNATVTPSQYLPYFTPIFE